MKKNIVHSLVVILLAGFVLVATAPEALASRNRQLQGLYSCLLGFTRFEINGDQAVIWQGPIPTLFKNRITGNKIYLTPAIEGQGKSAEFEYRLEGTVLYLKQPGGREFPLWRQ